MVELLPFLFRKIIIENRQKEGRISSGVSRGMDSIMKKRIPCGMVEWTYGILGRCLIRRSIRT